MEKITDWNALWRELVEIKARNHKSRTDSGPGPDIWAGRAEEYKQGVQRRWVRPDSSREFILSQIDAGSTVLDIGAGTGSWSVLLSHRAKRVTAVEPSGAMIRVMREDLAAASITNVSIVQGEWPAVSVEPHDFSLCSHAMYASPDLAAFLRRMDACTRRTCFLLLRAPAMEGVRAEAALHIWGQPLDSPNFTIAYNVLLQIGIYANVLLEDTGWWKPRTSSSLEEAFQDMKRFLDLRETAGYDDYLRDLLHRRLILKGGRYVWPPEVRSVLVYWRPGK
jgi:SAM-dependent methyltransferase